MTKLEGSSVQQLVQQRWSSSPSEVASTPVVSQDPWQWLTRYDLDLYVPTPQSWWQRLLFGTPTQRQLARSEHSLLILPPQNRSRQPWPLRRLLLILRGDDSDWDAVPWLARLATPGTTSVSLLLVTASLPRLHWRYTQTQLAPALRLAPNTFAGATLKTIRAHLDQRQVPSTVSLPHGEPGAQIRAATRAYDPDLILLAAEPHHPLLRLLYGELVKPLVAGLVRPLLIAR